MKEFLKNRVKESLEEVALKQQHKYPFGAGDFHKIYKFNNIPNRLFKIGKATIVDEWVDIFKEHPDLFARVYRVFPYAKDPELNVVEIERLDTNKAFAEYVFLDDLISDMNLWDDRTPIMLNNVAEGNNLTLVLNELKDKSHLVSILTKWVKLLANVIAVSEKDLGRPVDIHKGNFGYDNNGNLKALDI